MHKELTLLRYRTFHIVFCDVFRKALAHRVKIQISIVFFSCSIAQSHQCACKTLILTLLCYTTLSHRFLYMHHALIAFFLQKSFITCKLHSNHTLYLVIYFKLYTRIIYNACIAKENSHVIRI